MFDVNLMNEFLKNDGKLPIGFFGLDFLFYGWVAENTQEPLLVAHMRSEWKKGRML